MNAHELAEEARAGIAVTVSSLAAPEIDERISEIIKSAIEKAYQAGLNDKALSVLANWEKERDTATEDVTTAEGAKAMRERLKGIDDIP